MARTLRVHADVELAFDVETHAALDVPDSAVIAAQGAALELLLRDALADTSRVRIDVRVQAADQAVA